MCLGGALVYACDLRNTWHDHCGAPVSPGAKAAGGAGLAAQALAKPSRRGAVIGVEELIGEKRVALTVVRCRCWLVVVAVVKCCKWLFLSLFLKELVGE